ncbi:MAG: hypothetical protein H6689_01305 [Erysipelotrichaceae bacterium]|jgi:hypothetical protein|nr:hypothetical protein [Erysipelotrichaceae bacterium]MCB9500031.1 hypothetical protein [Erysipelotrichaceae bacterium]
MKEKENLAYHKEIINFLSEKDLRNVINVDIDENGNYVIDQLVRSVTNNKMVLKLRKIVTPHSIKNTKLVQSFLNIYI